MALRYTVRWVISKNKKLREAPEREPLAWLNRSSTNETDKNTSIEPCSMNFRGKYDRWSSSLRTAKGRHGEASGSGVVVKLEIASFTVHAWLIAMANARILPGFSHSLCGTEGTRSPESESNRLALLVKRIIEITPGASAAFTPIYLHPI